jgi:hypothetical protein
MHLTKYILVSAALNVLAWCDAAAQSSGGACPVLIVDGVVQFPSVGPGEQFGVTSYQCSSCSFKRERDAAAEYSFSSEPFILGTTPWSQLRVGDVVVAVNGLPITTRAGANQFTYPQPGETTVTVRRSGSRVDVKAVARPQCSLDSWFTRADVERVEVRRGRLAELMYGPAAAGGVVEIHRKPGPPPARVIRPAPNADPAAETDSAAATAGKYGFAISCLPSCTKTRASDGTDYWKFDGTPPIAGIRPGGPAALAGLQVGDVVLEIDGISILTEAGALRFQRAEQRESIRLTVQRDGRMRRVSLQLQAR